MCRFKYHIRVNIFNLFVVSIHPMCRFKSSVIHNPLSHHLVSIHPMCRFKGTGVVSGYGYLTFQYILCVGSSIRNLKY